MQDQRDRAIPQREGVHQAFQRIATIAEDVTEKASIYRAYADRLQRLIDEQDVAIRG